ncbi:RNase A-like domain-containing protein [Nocardioides terrigena]|uniref:RNase A-like domain-containing protein n=1 Tax=Nocardioides terrigena TaxID=424797 RepID=UPI000D303925|nr:RNase A-like domain-containing protein [Nocardioides terrigena]
MRIAVETGGFTSAADACRTGNQISALQCESLAGKLSGYAGMAGDDATSADFTASYDAGARQALDTLAELTHAFIGLGRLLTATGTNHRDAEAASAAVSAYSGGSLDEDDYVRVSPASPPSCLGANPVSLGTVETFILDHIEGFVWPGADTDLLLDAATTWRRAGAAVADLEAHCDIAAGFLEHQVSPEIPLALSALAELRSLIGDTADALVSVGTSCEEYADAVRDTHDRTRALLAEIGQMVVEGAVISAIVGGITGGLGAGAAGSAALARIGAQAPRFHALLVGLRATGTATAGRLRTAGDGLRTVRTRVEKFARVPARSERGSMKVPGGWGGARKPGWLRAHDVPPGHTIREHVGKTADELRERVTYQGRMKASSFDDLASAERLIDDVLTRKSDQIEGWIQSSSNDKLVLDMEMGHPTGTTVLADGSVVGSTAVKVILIPKSGTDDGWQLLTAFPN